MAEILIEYYNDTDIDNILYSQGYKDELYLDADLSKPDYEIIEEGEDNGDGDFHPTFRKWIKRYNIELVEFEEVVDLLTRLPVYDHVNIGDFEDVQGINVDVEWQEEETKYAKVTVSFIAEQLINRITNENLT